MTKLVFILSMLALSIPSFADQSASWTCTGKTVKIEGASTYLGENSAFEQTLYTLSYLDAEKDSSFKAYFLGITQKRGFDGSLTLSGKNEVGGTFEFRGSEPKDEGGGIIIRQTSAGSLSFSHGVFKGKNEPATCVFE